MTERASHRGADRTTPVPTLPAPSGEIDALVRDLLEIVQEMAIESRSTMGTITAIDGGEMTVHIDDERISRTIGFSRALGEEYRVDDRVKLSLLRNDEYVVDGIVSNAETDRRVGRSQIAVNAVGKDELGANAVEWGNLTADVQSRIIARPKVQTEDIADDAITGPKIHENAVNGGHIASESIGYVDLQHNGPGSLGADLANLMKFARDKGWIPKP